MISEKAVCSALEALGIKDTQDNIKQMTVFARAMEIYVQREAQRGSMWKDMGPHDGAVMLLSKAQRVKVFSDNSILDRGVDDALDACNYAAFEVRFAEGLV